MLLADTEVERALVVVAHPDDVDFWAGGTVAGWTSTGIAVTYCVLSDGDSGGFDPEVPRSAIPGIRRAEQEAAAALLGVADVRFLGYPDGCIEPRYPLRRDITRLIRQVQPTRMLTWSPEWSWRPFHRNHPDHRAAGEATMSAIFPDARNPFAHPELLEEEGLGPWEVGEVWLIGSPGPNHYVDVTDLFDRKLAALQVRGTLRRTREGLRIGTPKTPASRRKVVLSPSSVATLRRHQVRQQEERQAAGDLWQDFGLVFPNTLGRPMEPRCLLSDVYRPLLRRAGLPPITFHTLRHTAATLLLAEGEHPKVVQELLGHAQVSITLDRYSHMTPRLMSNAAALMDRLLDGEEPSSPTPDSS